MSGYHPRDSFVKCSFSKKKIIDPSQGSNMYKDISTINEINAKTQGCRDAEKIENIRVVDDL